MKAIICTQYGPPEVLQLRDVEKPTPKENEVLIRMHATAVTSGDARVRGMNVPTGFGFMTRLIFGFTKPRKPIIGMEFAGEVEAVGKEVKQFKPGDQVFGSNDKLGCYAEYVAVPEDGAITKKPSSMTYEEAAGVPFGALTSLVYLRDFGKIQKGQKVLINGASGGLGVFAVQLAKYFGADVTGVCSGANVDLVKSLGADTVVDYTKEDFTRRDETYDIIFDTVGKITFSHCKGSLKENGRFLLAVAEIGQFLQVLWTSMFGKKKVVAGVANFIKEDLDFVKGLIEEGKIRSVIDKRYPLEQIAEAHRHVDEGHKKGSLIITIAQESFQNQSRK